MKAARAAAPSAVFPALALAIALIAGGCATGATGMMDDESENPSLDVAQEPSASLEAERTAARSAAFENGIVTLGMTQEEVREIWGTPNEVEAAGRREGDERWVYEEGLSAFRNARIHRNRTVYFEHGRVAGWSSPRP